MHRLIIILSFSLFCSCESTRTETIDYISYYDKEHNQIRVEGKLLDSEENGEWIFYSPEGVVTEKGSYVGGLKDGIWEYSLPFLDTYIFWKTVEVNSFRFNLPGTFKLYSTAYDTSKIAYIDSVDGTVLGISLVFNCDDVCEENYYQSNLNTYNSNSINISFSESKQIDAASGTFYMDEYSFVVKDSQRIKQYLIYKKMQNQTMIVLSIVNTRQFEHKIKFILGQVFYHSKYNYERVAFPYDDIYKRVTTGKWE